MPNHPGHPALASSQELITGPGRISSALDAISVQTVTSSGYIRPRDGRYIIVQPSESITLTLPDPDSDPAFQNIRIVLKRTTGGLSTVTVVAGGTSTIDGASSFTLDAQYDCEVLFSSSTTGQWHRMRKAPNLLAPDYLDFGDWIVGTDDSNPAPTATSDQYVALDGTTTADKIEWDNSTELADESWAEPGAAAIEAGDTAEYSFYIDSEVGDGVKTVLEVGDSSVPQITEQATVAFSNVFAEEHISQAATTGGDAGEFVDFDAWTGMTVVASSATDPDGGTSAWSGTGNSLAGPFYATASASVPGVDGWTTGQTWTASWYMDSSAQTSGTYTFRFDLRTSGGAVVEYVQPSFNLASPGSITALISYTTGGPGYTVSNSVRITEVAGTSWYKYSVRVTDYSGTAGRALISPAYYGQVGTYLYYKPELRKGNHITGQQLLTVDDGVENILASVGILDATGFDDVQTNVASQSVSSIAAPDGTLTAIETVATSSTVAPIIQALLFETTATHTQIGDLWQDGLAWTFAIYAYMGQANAARITLQALTMTTAGVVSDDVFVTVVDGSVFSFVANSTGAVAYSAERNARVEAVGDTGWYRIEVTLQDYARTCNRIYLYIYGTSASAYDRHITWNPTLRYGDWVSREKNWDPEPDLLSKVIYRNTSSGTTSVTKELSSVVAPDGTLSAVDFTPQGTITDWSYWVELHQPPSTNGIPVPSGALVTVEFYLLHPIPFSAPSIGYTQKVAMRLLSGSTSVEQVDYILDYAAGGGISSISVITSTDPGFYTLANSVDVDPIGSSGWHRYRLRIKDTFGTVTGCRAYLIMSKQDGGDTTTIWNPRITVGNPADARGYFVSGPQNLLGDGSNYDPATSPWSLSTAGTVVTTNTAVAPNGRLEADSVTVVSGALPSDGLQYNSIPGSVLTGRAVSYHFYIRKDAAYLSPTCTARFQLADNPFTGVTEDINAFLNLGATPSVVSVSGTTTGGPGYTVDDVDIVEVSNDWVRVSLNLFDYAGTAQRVYLQHRGNSGASSGTSYDLTLWGSEITTIDRTPTATDLRPISGGIVDYDAYPAEHRSLFASYEDAGDNWYKVTMNLTEPN